MNGAVPHASRAAVLFGGGSLAAISLVTVVDPRRQPGALLAVFAAASLLYLFALVRLERDELPRAALWTGIGLALACRLWLIAATPQLSDDLYRYLWDGRVQLAGLSPYRAAPGDPALAHVHASWTRLTSNQHLPTIYPPTAQWFFRGAAVLTSSPSGLKLLLVACECLAGVFFWRWLRAAGRPDRLVLGLAWHPLLLVEVAGNGHVDIVGVMCLTGAALAAQTRRAWRAGALFGAAAGVKFVPLLLVPLLASRDRWREALSAVAVAAAVTAPFAWELGGPPLGSLGTYLEQWRFNGPLFDRVEWAWPSPLLPLLPVSAGALTALWMRRGSVVHPLAWSLPPTIAFFLAPAVYPWYLTWLLPFALHPAARPLLIWTLSSLSTYWVLHVVETTGSWTIPPWVLTLEFGLVALAAAWALRPPRR
jgi:hypothetical protein